MTITADCTVSMPAASLSTGSVGIDYPVPITMASIAALFTVIDNGTAGSVTFVPMIPPIIAPACEPFMLVFSCCWDTLCLAITTDYTISMPAPFLRAGSLHIDYPVPIVMASIAALFSVASNSAASGAAFMPMAATIMAPAC